MSKRKPTLDEVKSRMKKQNVSINRFKKALEEGNQSEIKSILGDIGTLLIGIASVYTGLGPIATPLVSVTGKILAKFYSTD